MNSRSEASHVRKSLTKLARLRRIGLMILLGALFILTLVLTIRLRDPGARLPLLTPVEFAAAQQRWQQHGLANYDVEVAVSTRQEETYRIVVRAGNVISATRNGQPLKQRRTFDTWSVSGMFNTMAIDLENVEMFAAEQASQTPQLTLRAAFDKERGYPLRYHRTEQRKWSPNYDVSWQVTFHAVASQ